jgi:hypothetical protein
MVAVCNRGKKAGPRRTGFPVFLIGVLIVGKNTYKILNRRIKMQQEPKPRLVGGAA